MPFLDDLIGIHDLTVNGGSAVPRRSVLNLLGPGVTATDNPVTGATDISLPTSVGGITISPPALTLTTNNYGPSGSSAASVQRWSSTGAIDVTGMDAGNLNSVASRPILMNVGSFTITLKHQSTSSTITNRFICPGNVDYALVAGATVEVVRDTVSLRWRVVA